MISLQVIQRQEEVKAGVAEFYLAHSAPGGYELSGSPLLAARVRRQVYFMPSPVRPVCTQETLFLQKQIAVRLGCLRGPGCCHLLAPS